MCYPRLTGLTKELWRNSQPIFRKITKTPLVTGLIDGLTTEEFHRFTKQDIYYLEESFQPAMKTLCLKASNPAHQKLFSDFVLATDIELAQLKKQISATDSDSLMPSEVCKKYGEHLLETTCNQPYSVGIAACLPCFLFFPAVGLYIKENVSSLADHPQAGWIKVYAEELFDNAYYMADLANEVISSGEQKDAIKAYITSAELELCFFEDALEIKKRNSYLMG